MISKLNQVNYDKVASNENVEVIDGLGSFIDDHTINIKTDGGDYQVYGERIFINTGARPFVPSVEGLEISNRVHSSETLMDLEELPESLAILGSGFIGLEFAASYAKFGTKVTIIDMGDKILPREDEDVAQEVLESYKSLGVDFIFNAGIDKVEQDEKTVRIEYSVNGKKGEIAAEAL